MKTAEEFAAYLNAYESVVPEMIAKRDEEVREEQRQACADEFVRLLDADEFSRIKHAIMNAGKGGE